MFNVEKLDKTIEHIEDEIVEHGCTAEMVSALASLIQARTLVESRAKQEIKVNSRKFSETVKQAISEVEQ